MNTYNPFDSLPFVGREKVDGVKIDYVTLGYALGDAIDGSHGNTKFWIDIIVRDGAATPTYAVSADGLTLHQIPLFVSSTVSTDAEYTVRKGIAPTATTVYVAQFMIDQTGSGGAPRMTDFVEFTINVPITYKPDSTMPWLP